MSTPSAHPPPGWGGTAETWRGSLQKRPWATVEEARPWGRVRWTPAGHVVDVVVREPGRRISPWPVAGLLAAAVVAGVLAAVLSGGAATGAAVAAGVLVLVLVRVARAQLRRGRLLCGPGAGAAIHQVATLERIGGRHGARQPELAAAARRAPGWLWALADSTLTPAEQRRLETGLREQAELALRADEHLVALGAQRDAIPARTGRHDPQDAGLADLVSALEDARTELDEPAGDR